MTVMSAATAVGVGATTKIVIVLVPTQAVGSQRMTGASAAVAGALLQRLIPKLPSFYIDYLKVKEIAWNSG